MNYIKIYFALPDELARERDELADYIRSLNDFYHDRDIFFEVNFAEDSFDAFDDFPSTSGNEENQIDVIRESNYFYLIFGNHDDEGIREKFDVALEEFGKNGAPKIYTYFKKLPEGVETEQGIKDFIDRLDQAIGHYYSQFVHIDSVKLNILLELTNISKNGDKLEFEDGHATINGTKVLPLDNIPIYQCNDTLQQLKAEKARLEQEFAGAAVNYAQNPNNQEAFNKMMDLSGERNRVTDKIHEIEKGMLGLCNTISEMRHSDRKLTWREIEAGKRLDMGDYDGALMILRDAQREKELAQAEAIANEGIERIRGYIAENRMIISTLKTKGVSVDTLDELYSRYEKNTELAKEYHIELDCIYNHMSFLHAQKEYSRAIELGEWLMPFYQKDDEKFDITNLLGVCHHDIHDFRQAEAFCELSLDISRRLARKNPEVYEKDVAMACNNFARLLKDLHRYEESEKLYREALDIRRRLSQKHPEIYEIDVSHTCGNLADLLRKLLRYGEAEKLHREALEICKRLAGKNPEIYEDELANTCNNLAGSLFFLHRYNESEKLYHEALKIHRRQAEKNPKVHEDIVALIGSNLAALLEKLNRNEESEVLYREALEIYRRLAQKDPDVYECDVADICYDLGILMNKVNRYKEAETLYNEAMKIYRICAQKNPEAYEGVAASACLNLANALHNQGRFKESVKLYLEANHTFLGLYQEHPEIYKTEYARSCYCISIQMMDLKDYREAQMMLCQSLRIYSSLVKSDPETYEEMCSKCLKVFHMLDDKRHQSENT